ncbi:MAG: S8 family peptidase [Rhodoferax sp.]|nr:S8 family peptidase [Rhodoferax sp.]
MHIPTRWGLFFWLGVLATSLFANAATVPEPERERTPARPQRSVFQDPASAQVIVKFRASSTLRQAQATRSALRQDNAPQHAAALSTRLRLPLSDGRVLGRHTQSLRGVGLSSAQLAAQLARQPDVEWAVVDERRFVRSAPNDPYFGPIAAPTTPAVGQWYLRPPDSTLVSAINALGAWSLSRGSAQVTVAVLDTGVRLDHPDLVSKLRPGYDFVSDTDDAKDGTARDDDASDPGDYAQRGECGSYQFVASSWHGTQVAGIVGAATDNGLGIAGVGRDVMVLPVRVLGACGGTDSDIIAGMRWAAGLSSDLGGANTVINQHPAKVINLSLGSATTCSQAYIDVLQELTAASVTVVVAAGNEAGLRTDSPANCPGALAVAGLRHLGTKVGFSNVGPEIAIAAPGGNCVNRTGACLYPIMTTSNAGRTAPQASTYTDSYDATVGTSFAAPQVSGTVGLMLSLNPKLSPADIRAKLQATARTFPTSGAAPEVQQCQAPSATEQLECYCTSTTCGAGMLDAAAALAAVVATPIARIRVDTSALQSSKSVFLNAAGSGAPPDRSITGYQWTQLSGQEVGAFVGTTTSAQATVVFVGTTGSVEVQLRVTDNAGASDTARQVLFAGTPPATPAEPAPAPSGGGGGSANAAWMLALLLACGWLWRQRAVALRGAL